mgnify:CR=1 FL=1
MNAADEDRRQAVRDAAAVWQRHLVDLGGRNSLLWQRTDDTVELDLTTAHPAGVAKLLSGRSVLLSQIVRSEHAYAEAYEKALAIRDLSRELLEERGILSCFLALGRATWQMSGDAVPAAPILLRQCDIHFGGRGGDDLVLEVSRTVELNSALSTYFASRGINIDHEYVTASSAGPHGFDPAPTYAMMRRAGASIPGFRIDERLVVSTFSYAKLSMVRDVAEQAPRLHTRTRCGAWDDWARCTGQALPPTPADSPCSARNASSVGRSRDNAQPMVPAMNSTSRTTPATPTEATVDALVARAADAEHPVVGRPVDVLQTVIRPGQPQDRTLLGSRRAAC